MGDEDTAQDTNIDIDMYGGEDDEELMAPKIVRVSIPVQLDDEGNLPESVVVHTVGEWEHPWFGLMSMDRKKINTMVRNFKKGIGLAGGGPQIHIDFEHKMSMAYGGQAAAWVGKVVRRNDDLVFTEIEWTDIGQEAVQNKRFKYMSAQYHEDFLPHSLASRKTNKKGERSETGFGPTITAAALTNSPFIQELPAILSENGEERQELSELEETDIVCIHLNESVDMKKNPQTVEDTVLANADALDEAIAANAETETEEEISEEVLDEAVDVLDEAIEETPEPVEANTEETVDDSVADDTNSTDDMKVELAEAREANRALASILVKDKVKHARSVASAKGVPPVVINSMVTLMEHCDITAKPTIKLSLTKGDEQEYNLFAALGTILELIPAIGDGFDKARTKVKQESEIDNTDEDKPFKLDDQVISEAVKVVAEIYPHGLSKDYDPVNDNEYARHMSRN